MHLEQRVPLFSVWIRRHLQSHQWGQLEDKRLTLWNHSFLELLDRIAVRLEHQLLHRQLRPAINDLHRPRQLLPQHCASQNVVPINHRLQRSDESVESRSGG